MNTQTAPACVRCSPSAGRRAFTLAELIVASVILTLVVGATTVSISQMLRSRDSAAAALEAFSRAQFAAGRIATDAQQALRDAELRYARISLVRGGPAGRTSQGLLLFTHQSRTVRTGPDAIESDEYEVQYRLEPALGAPVGGVGGGGPAGGVVYDLWRRADPNVDEAYDAGGVAVAIVGGITGLTLEAYDGSVWRSDWDSDSDGYPHALRITVTAADDRTGRTATVRRVVAFDRTPAPVSDNEEDEESEEDGAGSTPATSGSQGQGGASGAGGRGGGGGGR